ncbi:hypothetical protein TW65_91067 [Stemphylium lycopersici]|nr:hypothetical protein TW65_91067 [Stemphylium lycopersici]
MQDRSEEIRFGGHKKSEVVRLRANEARLESETRALYSEVNVLKRVLTHHGIPMPAEMRNHHSEITVTDSTASPGSSRGTTVTTDDTITLAVAQFPGEDSNKKQNRRKRIYVQQQHRGGEGVNHTPPCMGNLDAEAVGMDFVLTLESPCLPHIDVDVSPTATAPSSQTSASTPNPSITTGHALTLSACVFHSHPSPAGHRQRSSTAWHVPRASLRQLLALSSSIPLDDGEVTPVQAWEYVRRQEGFSALEVSRWEGLKEKLVAGVKCYGFGGVVEREVLQNAVFEAFVVGRIF